MLFIIWVGEWHTNEAIHHTTTTQPTQWGIKILPSSAINSSTPQCVALLILLPVSLNNMGYCMFNLVSSFSAEGGIITVESVTLVPLELYSTILEPYWG